MAESKRKAFAVHFHVVFEDNRKRYGKLPVFAFDFASAEQLARKAIAEDLAIYSIAMMDEEDDYPF